MQFVVVKMGGVESRTPLVRLHLNLRRCIVSNCCGAREAASVDEADANINEADDEEEVETCSPAERKRTQSL